MKKNRFFSKEFYPQPTKAPSFIDDVINFFYPGFKDKEPEPYYKTWVQKKITSWRKLPQPANSDDYSALKPPVFSPPNQSLPWKAEAFRNAAHFFGFMKTIEPSNPPIQPALDFDTYTLHRAIFHARPSDQVPNRPSAPFLQARVKKGLKSIIIQPINVEFRKMVNAAFDTSFSEEQKDIVRDALFALPKEQQVDLQEALIIYNLTHKKPFFFYGMHNHNEMAFNLASHRFAFSNETLADAEYRPDDFASSVQHEIRHLRQAYCSNTTAASNYWDKINAQVNGDTQAMNATFVQRDNYITLLKNATASHDQKSLLRVFDLLTQKAPKAWHIGIEAHARDFPNAPLLLTSNSTDAEKIKAVKTVLAVHLFNARHTYNSQDVSEFFATVASLYDLSTDVLNELQALFAPGTNGKLGDFLANTDKTLRQRFTKLAKATSNATDAASELMRHFDAESTQGNSIDLLELLRFSTAFTAELSTYGRNLLQKIFADLKNSSQPLFSAGIYTNVSECKNYQPDFSHYDYTQNLIFVGDRNASYGENFKPFLAHQPGTPERDFQQFSLIRQLEMWIKRQVAYYFSTGDVKEYAQDISSVKQAQDKYTNLLKGAETALMNAENLDRWIGLAIGHNFAKEADKNKTDEQKAKILKEKLLPVIQAELKRMEALKAQGALNFFSPNFNQSFVEGLDQLVQGDFWHWLKPIAGNIFKVVNQEWQAAYDLFKDRAVFEVQKDFVNAFAKRWNEHKDIVKLVNDLRSKDTSFYEACVKALRDFQKLYPQVPFFLSLTDIADHPTMLEIILRYQASAIFSAAEKEQMREKFNAIFQRNALSLAFSAHFDADLREMFVQEEIISKRPWLIPKILLLAKKTPTGILFAHDHDIFLNAEGTKLYIPALEREEEIIAQERAQMDAPKEEMDLENLLKEEENENIDFEYCRENVFAKVNVDPDHAFEPTDFFRCVPEGIEVKVRFVENGVPKIADKMKNNIPVAPEVQNHRDCALWAAQQPVENPEPEKIFMQCLPLYNEIPLKNKFSILMRFPPDYEIASLSIQKYISAGSK